jgi:hypothetical protein
MGGISSSQHEEGFEFQLHVIVQVCGQLVEWASMHMEYSQWLVHHHHGTHRCHVVPTLRVLVVQGCGTTHAWSGQLVERASMHMEHSQWVVHHHHGTDRCHVVPTLGVLVVLGCGTTHAPSRPYGWHFSRRTPQLLSLPQRRACHSFITRPVWNLGQANQSLAPSVRG